MKIWTGKLKLNGDRKREGAEVEARIVLGASVMFEVKEVDTWRPGDPAEIHAASWLWALAETGKEVA
jgi:hypothetical protein